MSTFPAFTKSPGNAFRTSPGRARSTQSVSGQQVSIARLLRVGLGGFLRIPGHAGGLGDNYAILGPLGGGSYVTAFGSWIDPVFLNCDISIVHGDGNSAHTVGIYNPMFADLDITATATWSDPATGSINNWLINPTIPLVGIPTQSFDFAGLGAIKPSGPETPPGFQYQVPDNVNPGTTVTVSNSGTGCTMVMSCPSFMTGPGLSITVFSVTMTINLTVPFSYAQYAEIVRQILQGTIPFSSFGQGATLLDAIASPTKSYPSDNPTSPWFLRYRDEFGQFTGFGGGPIVGTPLTVMTSALTRSGYVYQSAIGGQRGNPPLAGHGLPGEGFTAGTPPPSVDSVQFIYCVKSAIKKRAQFTAQNAWIFNPSTNTWTSQAWNPLAATLGGRYIFDPVTINLTAPYTPNPAPSSYTLDTVAPLSPTNFGGCYGTFP